MLMCLVVFVEGHEGASLKRLRRSGGSGRQERRRKEEEKKEAGRRVGGRGGREGSKWEEGGGEGGEGREEGGGRQRKAITIRLNPPEARTLGSSLSLLRDPILGILIKR